MRFPGYDLKEVYGLHVKGTILWIDRMNTMVALVIRCLVKKETRGGHQQKENNDRYVKMMETAAKHSTGRIK